MSSVVNTLAWAVQIDSAVLKVGQLSKIRASVDVDLGVWSARPGGGHLPEVVLAAEVKDMRVIEAGLVLPVFNGLFIGRNLAKFIFKNGDIKPFFG